MEQLACGFAIDVLAFSILSNHVHLVLRQRPDVVRSWSDSEVARRWLLICPKKRSSDGSACEPTEAQLNSIRSDQARLSEIRSRLSDISWWMRLMCQTIARRINDEDEELGRVWQDRYRAIRLLDETALLACAAYVDLNPIRAAIAENLEQSDFTSVQRRTQALKQQIEAACLAAPAFSAGAESRSADSFEGSGGIPEMINQREEKRADRWLAPVYLDELRDALQVLPSESGYRCSDRGFLNMTTTQYLELLDWTARSLAPGKSGSTPIDAPPTWQRLGLGLSSDTWLELVANFGILFKLVAGKPRNVDDHRGAKRPKRFRMRPQTRQLLTAG